MPDHQSTGYEGGWCFVQLIALGLIVIGQTALGVILFAVGVAWAWGEAS